MILLIALMYESSGSVTFSWVTGGPVVLVKYLKAGLGDWMASRNTFRKKTKHIIVDTFRDLNKCYTYVCG